MKKYYIVDNNGTVHAESLDREKLELLMHDIFTEEQIEFNEIEIIEEQLREVEKYLLEYAE